MMRIVFGIVREISALKIGEMTRDTAGVRKGTAVDSVMFRIVMI